MNYDFFDCKTVYYAGRKAVIKEKDVAALYPDDIMVFEAEKIFYYPSNGRVEAFFKDGAVWVIHDVDQVIGQDATPENMATE